MPSPRLKPLILPGIMLAGLTAFFASGAYYFFNWQFVNQHYTAIKGFAGEQKWISYLGFFCAYLIAVAFSLPVAGLLTLAGGAILGWPAATLVIVAATVGAGLVFFAAKKLFSDIFYRKAGPFLSKLEEGFYKNAFFYLLTLRLIPTAPFWVVNIIPALTRMGLTQFLVATLIGIIPGSCVYVWVGRGFDQVLSVGQTPNLEILASANVLLPLTALGALSLMPILFQLLQTRVKKSDKKANKTNSCLNFFH